MSATILRLYGKHFFSFRTLRKVNTISSLIEIVNAPRIPQLFNQMALPCILRIHCQIVDLEDSTMLQKCSPKWVNLETVNDAGASLLV